LRSARNARTEPGHIVLIEPIQRAPQAIIVEILCLDTRTKQMLNRLVFKEL
jgi:hypothetical protein